MQGHREAFAGRETPAPGPRAKAAISADPRTALCERGAARPYPEAHAGLRVDEAIQAKLRTRPRVGRPRRAEQLDRRAGGAPPRSIRIRLTLLENLTTNETYPFLAIGRSSSCCAPRAWVPKSHRVHASPVSPSSSGRPAAPRARSPTASPSSRSKPWPRPAGREGDAASDRARAAVFARRAGHRHLARLCWCRRATESTAPARSRPSASRPVPSCAFSGAPRARRKIATGWCGRISGGTYGSSRAT